MRIETCEIIEAENALLPKDSHFPQDAINIIKCWGNKEILACPGSGKTTVLLAKLKILSTRMPLDNGQGICVLSHTNVAVNAIKQKLSAEATTIKGYPNFVGTIDSFINRYIVLPYLRTLTAQPIHFIDNETYAIAVSKKLRDKEYEEFKNLVYAQVRNSDFYNGPKEFISALTICDDGLYVKKKKIVGAMKESYKQYLCIIDALLKLYGLLRYQDIYRYFDEVERIFGESTKRLVSYRFKYVFIDEYQDCSELQRNAIDTLFLRAENNVQKIGDLDQAIYNGINDNEKPWNPGQNSMPLCCAIRYGKEIADILTNLRTGKVTITASTGERKIKPTLIVFEDDQKQQVIGKFIEEIKHNNLVKPNGIYKAIGMCENVSGLKISDYWCEYRRNSKTSSNMDYPGYIAEIYRELMNGNIYLAEKCLRELICKLYRYCGVKNKKSRHTTPIYFSTYTIKQELAETKRILYRQTILDLAQMSSCGYDKVEAAIRGQLVLLLGETELIKLPKTFNFDCNGGVATTECSSTYISNDISVIFDTLWGVKGETHDATLYLETQRGGGTDISRVAELLKGKDWKNARESYEKSRKCVYVGFSRPKYLLCVAVQKKTFDKHKKAFENWKVVPLT